MNILASPYRIHAPEKALILDALVALREKATLEGKLLASSPAKSGKYAADASIEFSHENGTSRYIVECKSLIDRKTQIDQVRTQLESIDAQGLLIAPYISRELAHYCRATGLQFVDTCGNAYLRAPGLFVFITGEKGERAHQPLRAPKGLTTPAGLRVAFALLSRQELVNAPLKDIARHAGVALGSAYNVLENLEQRGYLLDRGSAPRRKLLERQRLLDEWTINYPTTLRTKLGSRRFSAPDPGWWQDVDAAASGFAWGSEVAAAKMTAYLKPLTQTLYVQADDMERVIRSLVKQHRIKPDQDGPIEILEQFWHRQPEAIPDIVPPLLVRADLLAILDPRAQETAEIIKERFIESTFDQG